LISAAEELAEEKRRKAAEKAATEKARIQEAKAAAREKYLDDLAQKADRVWVKVEDLISTTQPARYDEAMKLLVDLHDLAVRQGTVDGFRLRCGDLREKHANKPSLLRRMKMEGL